MGRHCDHRVLLMIIVGDMMAYEKKIKTSIQTLQLTGNRRMDARTNH